MNIFFLPESKLRNLIETLMGRGRLFWTRQKEKSITIEEVDEEYIGDYKSLIRGLMILLRISFFRYGLRLLNIRMKSGKI